MKRDLGISTTAWLIIGAVALVIILIVALPLLVRFGRSLRTAVSQASPSPSGQVLSITDEQDVAVGVRRTDEDSRMVVTGIATDTNRYLGKKVNFKGNISNVIEERAFTVDVGGDGQPSELLVIAPKSMLVAEGNREYYIFNRGDLVEIEGTVRSLDIRNVNVIERQLGRGVYLNRGRLYYYDGQPVVIAKSVTATTLE